MTIERVHDLTGIDPWFLANVAELVATEAALREVRSLEQADDALIRLAKRDGFSDRQLAHLWGTAEAEVRRDRKRRGISAVFKLVDTCAAEFEAATPYYYSTYEAEDEARVGSKPRVVVLGGGPNRIGQGIEFDYCCCQAAFALRADGFEVVMVNSNPETVSTDYDTSDRLFFEPLTVEDVLNVCERVEPVGVIVQFGGQTPLNLARALEAAGVPIWGTSPDSIDLAEDRSRFGALIEKLGLRQPPAGSATRLEEARRVAERVGYPVVVRPSFVLGGRAMEIVYDEIGLARYLAEAVEASPEHPVLIDKFLEDAAEVDVDAVCDGERTIVGGVMEHIEEAGIHSGDSACALPPFSLPPAVVAELERQTCLLADALKVRGLMNIQFAVKDGEVYVLEVNPRASRTVPFVSKATGLNLAQAAARVMSGRSLAEQGIVARPSPSHVSVKESVFPFAKFPGVDIVLGPEMRSTGEVMGIAPDFAAAFAKSQLAASNRLPASGTVFVSVAPRDRAAIVPVARRLSEMGYELLCTAGTAGALEAHGVSAAVVKKLQEGRPNLLDHLADGVDRAGGQHAQRQGRPHRRGPHPRRGGRPRRDVHHHHRRGPRRRRRAGAAPRRRPRRLRPARPAQALTTRPGPTTMNRPAPPDVMVPLVPSRAEHVPGCRGVGRRRVAIEHALALGQPVLWGEDARCPRSAVLIREGDGRREAFGAGLAWPAVAWLARGGQGGATALIAPPSWGAPVGEVFGPVDRARVETWSALAAAPGRPPPEAVARRLTPDDADAFARDAPGWALRSWRSFADLIAHGAAFGVASGGFASLCWTFEQGRDHVAIGAWTAPRLRRLGLARASAMVLIDHIIREAGKAPIWVTAPENVASRALARSLGFSRRTTETLLLWPARRRGPSCSGPSTLKWSVGSFTAAGIRRLGVWPARSSRAPSGPPRSAARGSPPALSPAAASAPAPPAPPPATAPSGPTSGPALFSRVLAEPDSLMVRSQATLRLSGGFRDLASGTEACGSPRSI